MTDPLPGSKPLPAKENVRLPLSLLLGTLAGVATFFACYLLVRGDHTSMGIGMFVGVPVTTGFVAAAVAGKPDRAAACCVSATFVSLILLLFLGLEGIICILMASPLIVAGVALGGVMGWLCLGLWLDRKMMARRLPMILALLLICPLLIAAVDRAERPYRSAEQLETFTNEVDLPLSREQAWKLLADMQPLDGPRPLLIRMGLPLPTRCELESHAVGARRVCHFDQGRIDQVITGWQPGERMAIDITQSTLPGRLWLRFDSAGYDLQEVAGQTRITRWTTIGTRLYPRWYWRPLERWGVTTEHTYVLANLRRRAQSPVAKEQAE